MYGSMTSIICFEKVYKNIMFACILHFFNINEDAKFILECILAQVSETTASAAKQFISSKFAAMKDKIHYPWIGPRATFLKKPCHT